MPKKKIQLSDLKLTSFITGEKVRGGADCTDYCNKKTYLCKMTCANCDPAV